MSHPLNLEQLRQLIDQSDEKLFILIKQIKTENVESVIDQKILTNLAKQYAVSPVLIEKIVAILGVKLSQENLVQLLKILQQRFILTRQVGEYKATQRLPATDPSREEQQMIKITLLASKFNLNASLFKQILRVIIDETVNNHKKIAKDNQSKVF